ncbi:MAG: WD40 repeat domain-containing protein, partial [Prevotellaceae bacterium]|nr:WD40 repeat domain-containing protein [Prevotellaceae bacterium]
RLNYSNSEFRTLFNKILQNIIIDYDKLLPIQEYYREEKIPELNVVNITSLLTQDMRLLYRDNIITAFPHQIYRDYLSAQWIIRQSQIEDNIMELWNSRQIPYPVMTHIRWGSGEYWKNGIACNVHKAGMDMTDDHSHFLVENLFSCFPGTDTSGTPDYSRLWLKGHRLPDNPIGYEKIDLSESEIDRTTVGLSSDDVVLYTNLCLSEEREFLAAIAVNDRGQQIQLNIFSLESGMMVFNHELNKKVGKMEFHGNRLFIVAGSVYVFSIEDDKQWYYSGIIGGDGRKNIFHKLQKCIIAGHILYLYYKGRQVCYDLRDCHMIDMTDWKQCENPIEGEDATSLRSTTFWDVKDLRQKDILSKVGNDSFQVISYGDGRLIVESEGEQQYELSRGSILLMDAAISGDGKSAATLGFHSVGTKRKVQLWNLDNEKRVADFACPSIVMNIHLSENGKWLMGETDDRTWVMNSENRNETWYEEHFVSNHMGKLITYGDKVIRKKGNILYLFDLKSGDEELLKSPAPNPSMVCFLPERTLAAADEKGKTLHLWSTRDGKLLSQYMDGRTILSIQPIQSKPFIAVFTDDQNIRIYHTGVRRQYDEMQCLIKKAGATNAKQMVAHQERPLIACTDGHRYLETRFYSEWTSYGKDKGLWKQNKFCGDRHVIDGDILDIAFNVYNQQIVAILSNGKIMYCTDTHCKYIDSFNIIV